MGKLQALRRENLKEEEKERVVQGVVKNYAHLFFKHQPEEFIVFMTQMINNGFNFLGSAQKKNHDYSSVFLKLLLNGHFNNDFLKYG